MKKIVSFLTVLFMLFSFCSCEMMNSSSVITVNGIAQLDTEIFTYFLNNAYYSSDAKTQDACISAATSSCLEYLAVNTHFAQLGKSLSENAKASVSRETNALWRLYGAYFEKIGVSKDTYFKIKQYEYARRELCLALYDTNGETPINEEYIRQYFTTNYVGIKYFYEELYPVITDEEYDALSENDKKEYDKSREKAQEKYDFNSEIANYVNNGVYTMDEAFMAVTGQVSADISVSVDVLGKTDSAFSAEFISAVFKQSVGSAFIITNAEKSNMYFIERVDLLDDEYSFYSEYRDECLLAVAENFFAGEINSWIQSYKTVRELSLAKRCFKKIVNIDRTEYVGTENYIFTGFKEDKK